MKKIFLVSGIIFFALNIKSQSFSHIEKKVHADTIYTKAKEKIACKIKEIGEYEFKYTLTDSPDGPLIIIPRTKVWKYTLSNGHTEIVMPDELDLETQHEGIMNNRTVVKFHPFSPMVNELTFAFEKVIHVGMNIDWEASYIDKSISVNGSNFSGDAAYYNGAYIKPGLKFFLGQDFTVRGIKYAHPLKGSYVKLEIPLLYMNFRGIEGNITTLTSTFNNSTNIGGNFNSSSRTYKTDASVYGYGFYICYGRQKILGNIMTLDYYFGMGYAGRKSAYSNSDYKANMSSNNNMYATSTTSTVGSLITTTYTNGYGDYFSQKSFYHAYTSFGPNTPIGITWGIRIGIIIPTNDNKSQKNKLQNTK